MPYSSHKTGKNKITVTKKDTGEVVGHTTPEKYNDYMAALHIHENDKVASGGVVTPIPEMDLGIPEPKSGDHKKSGTRTVFPYQRQPAVQMAEGGMVEQKKEDPEQTYRKGLDAFQKGDVQGSIGYFKEARDAGHPYAATALARATDAAKDEPQQFAKAPQQMAEGGIVQPENDFDPSGIDASQAQDSLSSPPQLASGEPAQDTHITNSQVDDPTALRIKATNLPATEKVSSPLPGMPSDITSDDIRGYLSQKKQEIEKYSPEQQMAVEQSLLKARTGLGGGLAQAGGGLADAIMQGVARAGPSNFQKGIQEQGQEVTGEITGAMKGAHEQEMQQTEEEMKLDASDPNSAPSKAAQGSIGQVLISKLGYAPRQVEKMSAQEIETTANLAMKYEDIETQAGLRNAMLQFQAMMGGATIKNQQEERQLQSATLAAQHPFMNMLGMLPKIPGAGNGSTAGPYGATTVRNGKTYQWSAETGKYHPT